jgi:hypothetical protein
VLLPKEALWLDAYILELIGFPQRTTTKLIPLCLHSPGAPRKEELEDG